MILDPLTDRIPGKLEKMVILSYKDSDAADAGINHDARFVALINPESYKLDYRVNFECGKQAQGKAGEDVRFTNVPPDELTFDFLFDDTGIIDGGFEDILKKPNSGIFDKVKEFREMLVGYDGEAHQTRVLVLVWGTLLFRGRATDLNIQYKLFNASGEPIRAVASVKFRGTVSEQKQSARAKNSSPDLTHIFRVKAGDTLPLMCRKIYGDPKYYFQVAAANRLGNFRRLQPGTDLVFPPIEK